MNKLIEDLELIEELRRKKVINKVRCNICGGCGTDRRSYPSTQCEECGGSGLKIEYIENKIEGSL